MRITVNDEYPKNKRSNRTDYTIGSTSNYHRVDGPAIEWDDGMKEWWVYSTRHNVNNSALEYNLGKEWYQNGWLHRVNGPAVEYVNGGKEWWVEGKRHRVDGPAVVTIEGNGKQEWYIQGVRVTPR